MAGDAVTVGRIAEALAARDLALQAGCAEGTAVARLLHPSAEEKPRLLVIERAHREGNPWSGSP